jgi:hypothetical protein
MNPLPGAGRDASAIEQDRDHQAGQRGPSPTAMSRNSVSIMPVWKSPSHPSFPSSVFVHGFPHANIARGKSSTNRTDGNIDRSRMQGLRKIQSMTRWVELSAAMPVEGDLRKESRLW